MWKNGRFRTEKIPSVFNPRPKQATMEEGTTPVVCHPEDTRNGDAYEEWRKLLRFASILSVVPLVHQLTLASLCPPTFF
jgi:hypothetical protein